MKIQASKTMAKTLNKYLKGVGSIDHITFETCNANYYDNFIGESFLNECDWDMEASKMKYIAVIYKNSELCAMDKYFITTRILQKVYKDSNKTLDGFIKAFNNLVQI